MDIRDIPGIQEVHNLVAKAQIAQETMATLSQDEVDRIVASMAKIAQQSAEYLARMAAGETAMGRVESKTVKNLFAATQVYESISQLKTVGIIGYDEAHQCYEVAQPVGIIAAILPTTNPTSTAIFKSLIAIKARNVVIFAPHPKAVHCTAEAVKILHTAAVSAGAPENCLQCIHQVSLNVTQELMTHPEVDFILATGGPGLVKAAYQSGKPAIGVGQGNAPAYIDRSANLAHAVRCIVESKTFDNGTICSSEQSVIIDEPIYDSAIREFQKLRAYVLSPEEVAQLSKYAIVNGHMNPEVVGQPASKIAQKAGINAPSDTTVLLAFLEGVGPKYPLSHEILAPILALYKAKDWQSACERSLELLNLEGAGHTLALHATNPEVITQFALHKPVSRLLVNAPSSQGGVGFATYLLPSLTLGCGTSGGNITSDNISAKHLISIKRVATIRSDFPLWGKDKPINPEIAELDLIEDQYLKLPPGFGMQRPLGQLWGVSGKAFSPANRAKSLSAKSDSPAQKENLADTTTPAQPSAASTEKSAPSIEKNAGAPSTSQPNKLKEPWQVQTYSPPSLERFRDMRWP